MGLSAREVQDRKFSTSMRSDSFRLCIESAQRPSGLKQTEVTIPECPSMTLSQRPSLSDQSLSFHVLIDNGRVQSGRGALDDPDATITGARQTLGAVSVALRYRFRPDAARGVSGVLEYTIDGVTVQRPRCQGNR